MSSENYTLRTPTSIGCCIVSTAVVQALQVTGAAVNVQTEHPELFSSLEREVNRAQRGALIDVSDYLKSRPHQSRPYRPLYEHMLEYAAEQAGKPLPPAKPRIVLSEEELSWAREFTGATKPLLWLHLRTNSLNKNVSFDDAETVVEALRKRYKIIDLASGKYSLREALSLIKVAAAGITIDSFPVHGAAAVGAKNVLVLLGSSRPEVICYEGQTVLYKEACSVQPCGMHSLAAGCKIEDEQLFKTHERTNCITDNYRCMREFTPDTIVKTAIRLVEHA